MSLELRAADVSKRNLFEISSNVLKSGRQERLEKYHN
jgi:hypothetical protein